MTYRPKTHPRVDSLFDLDMAHTYLQTLQATASTHNLTSSADPRQNELGTAWLNLLVGAVAHLVATETNLYPHRVSLRDSTLVPLAWDAVHCPSVGAAVLQLSTFCQNIVVLKAVDTAHAALSMAGYDPGVEIDISVGAHSPAPPVPQYWNDSPLFSPQTLFHLPTNQQPPTREEWPNTIICPSAQLNSGYFLGAEDGEPFRSMGLAANRHVASPFQESPWGPEGGPMSSPLGAPISLLGNPIPMPPIPVPMAAFCGPLSAVRGSVVPHITFEALWPASKSSHPPPWTPATQHCFNSLASRAPPPPHNDVPATTPTPSPDTTVSGSLPISIPPMTILEAGDLLPVLPTRLRTVQFSFDTTTTGACRLFRPYTAGPVVTSFGEPEITPVPLCTPMVPSSPTMPGPKPCSDPHNGLDGIFSSSPTSPLVVKSKKGVRSRKMARKTRTRVAANLENTRPPASLENTGSSIPDDRKTVVDGGNYRRRLTGKDINVPPITTRLLTRRASMLKKGIPESNGQA